MQNRTMRAAVSTRRGAALRELFMTWRTFTEIDRASEDVARLHADCRALKAVEACAMDHCLSLETAARRCAPGSLPSPGSLSLDLPVDDGIERHPGLERIAAAQGVDQWPVDVREGGDRVGIVQGNVVEQHHLHEVRHVIAGRTAGGGLRAVRIEIAELQTELRVALRR